MIDVDKFIVDNYSEIFSMCIHAARVGLPLKKGWGFSVESNTYDEAEGIINLVKDAIVFALESGGDYGFCESGFYKVHVELGDMLFIDINFNLEYGEFVYDIL